MAVDRGLCQVLKLTVDSRGSANYPEFIPTRSKERKIFTLRPVFKIRKPFLILPLLLTLMTLTGCAPIRQSMERGDLFGDGAGTLNGSPGYSGNASGGPPGNDDWQSQMEGVASWYGPEFNGRLTASGEVYDMYALTAAHRTLPLGTVVKVTNEDNGKTVQVRVNDRGPFMKDRVIDLSKSACESLDMMKNGTAHVKLEVVSWPAMASK